MRARISLVGGWVVLAFFLPSAIWAQLFSRTNEPGTPVIILDPISGALQRVAATGEVTYSGVSGLDTEGKRIFVLAADPPGQKIVTVNLRSGAVSSARLSGFVPDLPRDLHFDSASHSVLAIASPGGVLRIDPQTGTIQTDLGNFVVCCASASAFDPVARRLYALNGDSGGIQTLQVLDLGTGQLTLHSIASTRYYGFITWDPVTRRLLSATSEAGLPIVSIDPDTGLVTPLLNTGSPILPFQSALDPAARRLFFLSFVPASAGGSLWTLHTVNLATRSATTVPLAAGLDYLFLEFLPAEAAAVPIVGPVGLAALAIGLAMAGASLAAFARSPR